MFYSNWRLHSLVKDGSTVRFVEFRDTDAARCVNVRTPDGRSGLVTKAVARRIWSEYRAQGFIPSEEVTPCTE